MAMCECEEIVQMLQRTTRSGARVMRVRWGMRAECATHAKCGRGRDSKGGEERGVRVAAALHGDALIATEIVVFLTLRQRDTHKHEHRSDDQWSELVLACCGTMMIVREIRWLAGLAGLTFLHRHDPAPAGSG